ncbi:CYFA0S08e02542g1_1 [Cyberlindnera fabianii]|uniref:CYFA0S08e02542g1_1 n=1 Tax=Cyberlindnera fabianii TaxID=36022 RepID=A0A061B311_CYBFA|nr:Chromatin-remodeling complex subunit IES6 [Cyberlindnera fabianii]CDR42007.1 CYFA0S08e02542g1_1 [Cyberlindnera fabianii]
MTESPVSYADVHLQNSTAPSFKATQTKRPNRRVKPLKQLLADEQKHLKTLQDKLKTDAPTYFSIESPPSIKPTKKYCDITGLEGKYKSPTNGIRYHNSEVYTIVKNMSQGVDQQYLELRNANTVLK